MDSVKSVLNLDSLAFEDLQFKRDLSINEPRPEYEMNFTRSVSETEDENRFKVSLSSNMRSKKGSITVFVKLSAMFTCQCEDEQLKASLINDNTMAILFPYLRSQISLVTTQPSLQPVVIPPVNIVQLFKNLESEKE